MISVPLRLRRARRAQLFQKIQHALPAAFLLPDGLARLRAEPHGLGVLLGATEVVASAAVAFLLFKAIRAARRPMPTPAADRGERPGGTRGAARGGNGAGDHAGHHDASHGGIDWVDVALAGLLATEAFVHRAETGHLPRPTIVLAPAMLVLGLMHGRIQAWGNRRRALRVGDDGISIPGRFFGRLTASWAEVASIEIGPAAARVALKDGRSRTIDLAGAENQPAIARALEAARERLAALADADARPGAADGTDAASTGTDAATAPPSPPAGPARPTAPPARDTGT
ncbi:MAG: hypothetical protein R2752_16475 [Vicinamibacterales bacterium]